jgi:hypothetical protein
VTATIRRELRRRSAIEPVIGHMKTDGRLGRNFLVGARGDAINALLCGAGYNLRLIINYLRRLLRALLRLLADQPCARQTSDWQAKIDSSGATILRGRRSAMVRPVPSSRGLHLYRGPQGAFSQRDIVG